MMTKEIAQKQKLMTRDVEEITASNWYAKQQMSIEQARQATLQRMRRQAKQAEQRQIKRRTMANLSYVIMGAFSTLVGLALAAGEIGAAGVFGLIILAAIGGAVGNERR